MTTSTEAVEIDPKVSGQSGPVAIETIRPQLRWADLWEAPLHDFPVRDEILCQCLPLTPAMRILEIGPGTGFTAFWLARQVRHMTLVDASNQALAEVKQRLAAYPNVEFLEWNLSRPGLAEQVTRRFDAAFGLDVFEYVSSPKIALHNLADAIRPGGRLLLTFPNTPHPEGDAVTYFNSPAEIRSLMESAGFGECRIFTIKLRAWAGAWHRALHDWPLDTYRRLRGADGTDLPRIYEQTWAFQNRNGMGRLKTPLHALWLVLRLAMHVRGNVFAEEPASDEILGRRLVICAQK